MFLFKLSEIEVMERFDVVAFMSFKLFETENRTVAISCLGHFWDEGISNSEVQQHHVSAAPRLLKVSPQR